MLQDEIMALTIDQNPKHQARSTIDVILHHFGFTAQTWLTPPYASNVSFRLFSPENMVTFSKPARD